MEDCMLFPSSVAVLHNLQTLGVFPFLRNKFSKSKRACKFQNIISTRSQKRTSISRYLNRCLETHTTAQEYWLERKAPLHKMLQPFPQLSIFTNVYISSAILERKGSWVRTQTLRKSGRGKLILRAFSVIFSIWRKPRTDFLLTICYSENRPRIPFGRARANARNVSLIVLSMVQ